MFGKYLGAHLHNFLRYKFGKNKNKFDKSKKSWEDVKRFFERSLGGIKNTTFLTKKSTIYIKWGLYQFTTKFTQEQKISVFFIYL